MLVTCPDCLDVKLKTYLDLGSYSLDVAIEEVEAEVVHAGLVPRHEEAYLLICTDAVLSHLYVTDEDVLYKAEVRTLEDNFLTDVLHCRHLGNDDLRVVLHCNLVSRLYCNAIVKSEDNLT